MRVTLYDANGNTITDGLEDPRKSHQAAHTAIHYAKERRRAVVLKIGELDLKIGRRASKHLVEIRAVRLAHKTAADWEEALNRRAADWEEAFNRWSEEDAMAAYAAARSEAE